MTRFGCKSLLVRKVQQGVKTSGCVRLMSQCYEVQINQHIVANAYGYVFAMVGCMKNGWAMKYRKNCDKAIYYQKEMKYLVIDFVNSSITVNRLTKYGAVKHIVYYFVLWIETNLWIYHDYYTMDRFVFTRGAVMCMHTHYNETDKKEMPGVNWLTSDYVQSFRNAYNYTMGPGRFT